MKTIRQHFEENLGEDELKRALANCSTERLKLTTDTPSSALFGSFQWYTTPEGHDYWYSIHHRLLNQPK